MAEGRSGRHPQGEPRQRAGRPTPRHGLWTNQHGLGKAAPSPSLWKPKAHGVFTAGSSTQQPPVCREHPDGPAWLIPDPWAPGFFAQSTARGFWVFRGVQAATRPSWPRGERAPPPWRQRPRFSGLSLPGVYPALSTGLSRINCVPVNLQGQGLRMDTGTKLFQERAD